MKYSIVIPCYNESDNIYDMYKILNDFERLEDTEFILVENGSKDNSKEIFEKTFKKSNKHFKIVYVEKNRGYGYGIQQGLKVATGKYVGWLHADLQVKPKELIKLYDYIETSSTDDKVFLKGKRKNRSLFDVFFTANMTIFELIVFKKVMTDIGAIPVLFNKELLKQLKKAPYDFSIELFSYYQAKKNNYKIKRFPVILEKREKGKSSWNNGFKSKIKQSILIMKDSIKIKKGEQVK